MAIRHQISLTRENDIQTADRSSTKRLQDAVGILVRNAQENNIKRISINLDTPRGIPEQYLGNDPEKAAVIHALSWEERFYRWREITRFRWGLFTEFCKSIIKGFKEPHGI